MIEHQLSRRDARRIAVRAQLLERQRPTELLDLVRNLTFLQIDTMAAIAPRCCGRGTIWPEGLPEPKHLCR